MMTKRIAEDEHKRFRAKVKHVEEYEIHDVTVFDKRTESVYRWAVRDKKLIKDEVDKLVALVLSKELFKESTRYTNMRKAQGV